MSNVLHDDVVTILDYFEDLPDPRSTINRRHCLGDLIVIAICGVIAGADGPKAIGVWAESNAEWLRQRLTLSNGIPSHDTIGRLLATLNPRAFHDCFQNWVASLRIQTDDGSTTHDIAVDGKALRRSHEGARKNRV